MPTKHSGYCANCGKYFEGFKKQYCSWQCRVAKTGKDRAKIMQEKNILYPPKKFDTLFLEMMYIQQQMSCAEIGKCYGVAPNTIRKVLYAKGIRVRGFGELNSVKLKGIKRSKGWIQKHKDWYKIYGHPMKGRFKPITQKDFFNKSCPNCGIIFQYSNWRQKFCSPECWYNYECSLTKKKKSISQDRIVRICVVCGQPFSGQGRKYCSRRCLGRRVGELSCLKPEKYDTQEIKAMYYRQHMGIKDVAKAYGVSDNAFKKIMIIKGIKLRTRFEQMKFAMTGLVRGEKFGKEISIRQKGIKTGRKRSPEEIAKMKATRISHGGFAHKESTKQKLRETHRWKFKYDTEFLAARAKWMAVKPNKPEKVLIHLIDEMRLPYKYVGDFKFWIDGKNPDFINTNSQKKIIEMYGKHWHDEEEMVKRKFLFAQYGYDTLFIWDNELENIEGVKQKLLEFDQKPHAQ